MPEFEESDSQSKPEHNYIPSTSATKSKGGRRRSGGFKSEASTKKSNIGEVDPAEVLEIESHKSAPRPDNASDTQTACSIKDSKTSDSSCSLSHTKKSTATEPQPSKATLDSIKKVEERIAKSHAESEKNRPDRDRRSSKRKNGRIHKKGRKAVKRGFFSAMGQFFGKLFGSNPKNSFVEDEGRPPRRHKPKGKNQRRSHGNRRDDSEKRSNNYRRGPKRRRKNASQNT